MNSFFETFLFVILCITLLVGLIKLVKGPSIADRLISLDLFSISVMSLICFHCQSHPGSHLLELLLVLSMLAFGSSLLVVFYEHSKDPDPAHQSEKEQK